MNKYEELHQMLSRQLLKIAGAISPAYKLTLVCRHPINPNAHIIIGDDEDKEAVALLLTHPEMLPVETR